MSSFFKILGGVVWLLASVALGVVAFNFLYAGAGLPSFVLWVSSGSVLVGWIQLVAILTLSLVSFAIGAVLLACGLVPPPVVEGDRPSALKRET